MKTAILKEKIVETYLIVHAMGDPDIKACIETDPDYALIICDGKEDSLIEDDPTRKGKELYIIKKFENHNRILYLHLKRMRPVKLCVYEIVEKKND